MADEDVSAHSDKSRLRDIIRLTADLVWETDRDHCLTLLSDNALDLLGDHGSAFLKHKLTDVWQMFNDGQPVLSLDWRQPFREIKATYARDPGRTQHFLLSGLPVFDEKDGTFICVRGIAKEITKVVQSDEERRKLEERSSAVIDFASTGIAVADKEGQIVECNEAWLRFFGYRRNDMLGTSFKDLTYSEDVELSLQNMASLFSGDIERYRQEKRYLRFDGSVAWADVSVSSLKAPDGTVTHSIAGLNDITDRKLAEIALETSRQKLAEQSLLLQTTLDTIDQGFAVWDDEDRLVAWNRTVSEMWFLSDELEVGLPRRNLFEKMIDVGAFAEGHEPDGLNQHFDAAGQNPIAFESVFKNRDRRDIHIRRYTLPDGGYASVYTDITNRLTAERAVRESEEKFRTIAEASGAAIFIVSSDSEKFLYSNNAAADMFLYSVDELIQTRPLELFAEDDVQSKLLEEIGQARKISQFECKMIRNGSEKFWAMIAVETVRFETEDTFLFLVTDISHLKEIENELRSAKDEADKANRVKTDFLSSMSHELRTPMNSILGFTQLMAEDPKTVLSEEQQESLGYIMRSGRHLLNLINDVLDFANIEAAEIEIGDEAVSVLDLCTDSLNAISKSAEERQVKTSLNVNDGLVVAGDPTRLKQILLNLLSNAVKYNVAGGSVNLSASVAAEGEWIRISVADTGRGIARDKQEGLFQAFNRLGAENTEVEGTGIGLSICARLIEVMEGRIGYESAEGQGSIFWIEVLAKSTGAEARNQNSAEQRVSETEIQLAKLKGTVLYVEDNPANLLLMQRIVDRVEGVTLRSAMDAEQGLIIAAEEQPDLIIMDISLPGMDGFEALQHLKSDSRTAHLPVIALSANALPAQVERGEEAGFAAYMTKPIDILDVSAKLKAFLTEG
jgi:PAS domain S-box-containing protein